MLNIAKYCCFDVKVTREVHRFGAREGYVLFDDKEGKTVRVDVDWSLD